MSIQLLEVSERVSAASRNYYRVIQELGDGGNSCVYLVEALSGPLRGVLFAMKVFVKIGDDTRRGRFLREIGFLQECEHPAIMRVHDSGNITKTVGHDTEIYPFVIADYMPQTLRKVMLSGVFSISEKMACCLQLLSGLTYLSARESQIVHRDIKPENIFVRGKSYILGDFGLMKALAGDDGNDQNYIIESAGPRLPRFYRSPDLVDYSRGVSALSAKSDVFQMGLVFAEIFTGESPLRPAKNILDPVELSPLLPIGGTQGAAITGLLRQMLELDPARRPHAADLLDPWEGVFLNVVKMSHQLDGRVF